LQGAPAEPRVGVRGASPDGWPLVGPSCRPGIWLAAGMRRNGWAIAPLAAEMLVSELAGERCAPWAGRLEPGRFGRPEAA
jgi:glycine oxidase